MAPIRTKQAFDISANKDVYFLEVLEFGEDDEDYWYWLCGSFGAHTALLGQKNIQLSIEKRLM
jgi:hypothetical protein